MFARERNEKRNVAIGTPDPKIVFRDAPYIQ